METTNKEHNLVENNILILSKQTFDLLLKQRNPGDLISLYTFYYYTAKWQRTNQPKASVAYVAKGLHWNKDKVIKVKKQLEELGLIEEIRRVDENTGKVLGWYIRIVDLWKVEEPHSSNPESGFQNPNAFSAVNKNAFKSFSKENGEKPHSVKTIGSLLKEKFNKLQSKTSAKKTRINHKFQAYAVEAADLAGLKNGGRNRLFQIFKQKDYGYTQLEKTKQVVISPNFKKLNTEDEKVRYLAGSYRRSL